MTDSDKAAEPSAGGQRNLPDPRLLVVAASVAAIAMVYFMVAATGQTANLLGGAAAVASAMLSYNALKIKRGETA